MKKRNNLFLFIVTFLPITMYAHGGHEHTGSLGENIIHFLNTNLYFVFPLIIASYFLYRYAKSIRKSNSDLN